MVQPQARVLLLENRQLLLLCTKWAVRSCMSEKEVGLGRTLYASNWRQAIRKSVSARPARDREKNTHRRLEAPLGVRLDLGSLRTDRSLVALCVDEAERIERVVLRNGGSQLACAHRKKRPQRTIPEALNEALSDSPESNDGIAGAFGGAAFFAPALGAALGLEGKEASSSARRRSRSAFFAVSPARRV